MDGWCSLTYDREYCAVELGDILMKVGDTVINTESDLFRALETYKPGDKIKVTINRVSVDEDSAVILKSLQLTIPLQSSVDVEKKMNLYQFPAIRND
jgi:S1-C subfamily serine protease